MKNKFTLFLVLFLMPVMGFATNAVTLIQNDLKNFADSWNKGNIKEIAQHYRQSDSSKLIWSEITTGYENIASYLQKTYSSTNNMGTLKTSHVEIKLLSPRYALVTGNWLIKETNGTEIGGPFSMIYENTKNGWKIILDHGTTL